MYKNSLIETVTKFIETNKLIEPNNTIIIGLSGGPDSVFLVHVLKSLESKLNLKLIAAHLDHQWRPNSYQDVEFCQNLAQKLDIEFVSEKASSIKFDSKSKEISNTGSLEELGRTLRRTFFELTAQKFQANSIALGHHKDDQVETFFIRLIRGASIAGLASMRSKTESPNGICYIRPLLSISKSEILTYLDNHKIKYLTDYTNNLDIFLRNKIRKNLIPVLSQCDSRFEKNFQKTLDNIQQTDQFLDKISKNIFNQITETKNNTLWLDLEKFLQLDPYLYPRILILWLCDFKVPFTPSDSFFKEIIRFFKQKPSQETKKHTLHTSWSILKTNSLVTISKN